VTAVRPKRPIAFDTVRELARGLPGVEVGTAYGSPALKVGGRMFACMAIHRSAEPHSLAIRMDFADRDELVAADPATYYLTDHYVDYPVVLVRLGRVHRDALNDLLRAGWRFESRRARRSARTHRTRRARR
jgi:hypothetical protein